MRIGCSVFLLATLVFLIGISSANLVCPWDTPETVPVVDNQIENSLTGTCIGFLTVVQDSVWGSQTEESAGITGERFDLFTGEGATAIQIGTETGSVGHTSVRNSNRTVQYSGDNAILYDTYAAEDSSPVPPFGVFTGTPVNERVSGGTGGNFDSGTYHSEHSILNTPGEYISVDRYAVATSLPVSKLPGMSGNLHTWDTANTQWGNYVNDTPAGGVDLWTIYAMDTWWRGVFNFEDVFSYQTEYIEEET